MKGWLENYNDSKVSTPEGFQGEGYDTSGRDFSPAWGGQFAMGGSIPGSVGFTYARTNSPAPSNGKYAKKTMASAQEGKTITVDEGDGKKRKILTDSKEYADLFNQGKIGVKNDDESISMNPLNEVVVTPYDKQYPFYQELSDEEKKYFNSDSPIGRQLRSRAQDNVGFNADKATDFAMGWLKDLPLAGLQAPQSAFVEGVEAIRGNDYNFLDAITPGEQRRPSDVWGIENDYYGVNPLNPMLPSVNYKTVGNTSMDIVTDPLLIEGLARQPLQQGLNKAGKVLGTESGLLSNTYKLNPLAGKLNRYNRIVGEDAVNDLIESKLVRTPQNLKKEIPTTGININRKGTTPYPSFGEGIPNIAKNTYAQKIISSGQTPYIISTNNSMGLSTLGRHGKGSTLFPIDESGKYLESFSANKASVFEAKPHWLQGYKQIPKQEDGGVIKDDMGQWAHPGEITEIGSNQITMQGVPYPVLGVSDEGDVQMMYPEEEYEFVGKKVTEFPMAKNGIRQEQKGLVNLDQLTNFTNYNTKQPGGWMDKYQ